MIFFYLLNFFLCTGVIFASFNADGKTDWEILSFRFSKIKSTKMSKYSLINLVGMSVFCVALIAFKFFISFKISYLSTNEKLKRVLELQFSLIGNNARMGHIFNNYPHNWATDGSRYWILLFILWDVQISNNSKKEIIQNLDSFFIIF